MELRQYPRETVHAQQRLLHFSDKNNHFEKDTVISKNISASGFCFRTSRSYEHGQVIFVYVSNAVLEDLKCNKAGVMKVGNYFMAKIVWCRSAAQEALPTPSIDPFYEIGCSFIPMAEGNGDSISLFTRFVNHFTVDAF